MSWLGYAGKSEIENLLEKMAQGQVFWQETEKKNACNENLFLQWSGYEGKSEVEIIREGGSRTDIRKEN